MFLVASNCDGDDCETIIFDQLKGFLAASRGELEEIKLIRGDTL